MLLQQLTINIEPVNKFFETMLLMLTCQSRHFMPGRQMSQTSLVIKFYAKKNVAKFFIHIKYSIFCGITKKITAPGLNFLHKQGLT
jgi:hypothetical protein